MIESSTVVHKFLSLIVFFQKRFDDCSQWGSTPTDVISKNEIEEKQEKSRGQGAGGQRLKIFTVSPFRTMYWGLLTCSVR